MKKSVTIGKKTVSVIGNFQLKYNGDAKRFRMTNINSFVPPGKSIEDKLAFKTQQGLVESLIISKLILSFKPDVNPDNVNKIVPKRRGLVIIKKKKPKVEAPVEKTFESEVQPKKQMKSLGYFHSSLMNLI